MLQKASEQVAECLLKAAEAQERADAIEDAKRKADYLRIAEAWRMLARSHEFQGSLGRFISFNNSRAKPLPPPRDHHHQFSSPVELDRKADLLDSLAWLSERIRPYSVNAFGIALVAVAAATLLHLAGGWASSDLRFAIYLPAILATGLLAGVPAAIGGAIASIVVIFWAFMPPYFAFKWPSEGDQINILLNAIPYLITVYFAYLCRVVLWRLRRSELNNRVLAKELEHRGRNLFSIMELIIKKTLLNDPVSAETLVGRLRSIRHANELLTGKACSVSLKELLLKEFAIYGVDRLHTYGPNVDVEPHLARHFILLFHELATNAAKYGALSCADGRVYVEWQLNRNKLTLTWKECGGPLVSVPESKGFGNQLIATCVRSLDGTIHQFFMPEGFACSVNLRLGTSSDEIVTSRIAANVVQ